MQQIQFANKHNWLKQISLFKVILFYDVLKLRLMSGSGEAQTLLELLTFLRCIYMFSPYRFALVRNIDI